MNSRWLVLSNLPESSISESSACCDDGELNYNWSKLNEDNTKCPLIHLIQSKKVEV